MTQPWISREQWEAAVAETPAPADAVDLVAIAATPRQFEALRDLVNAVHNLQEPCCFTHAYLFTAALRNAMDRVVALGVKL